MKIMKGKRKGRGDCFLNQNESSQRLLRRRGKKEEVKDAGSRRGRSDLQCYFPFLFGYVD